MARIPRPRVPRTADSSTRLAALRTLPTPPQHLIAHLRRIIPPGLRRPRVAPRDRGAPLIRLEPILRAARLRLRTVLPAHIHSTTRAWAARITWQGTQRLVRRELAARSVATVVSVMAAASATGADSGSGSVIHLAGALDGGDSGSAGAGVPIGRSGRQRITAAIPSGDA